MVWHLKGWCRPICTETHLYSLSLQHLGRSVWLERMMRHPELWFSCVGDKCDVILSTCYPRKSGVFLLCLGYCDWKLFCLSGGDFGGYFLHSCHSLVDGGWIVFLQFSIILGLFCHTWCRSVYVVYWEMIIDLALHREEMPLLFWSILLASFHFFPLRRALRLESIPPVSSIADLVMPDVMLAFSVYIITGSARLRCNQQLLVSGTYPIKSSKNSTRPLWASST